MATIINKEVVESRDRKRIWIQGAQISKEGFEPGQHYDIHKENNQLKICLNESGKYVVSKRDRNGRITPIMDLTQNEVAELFSDVEMVRIVIRQGKIVITAHHHEERVSEREERLLKKIAAGEKLAVGSLFHGGGVLDKAIHHGLQRSGVSSAIRVAIELEGGYLDSSLNNNPELWDERSIAMETQLQSVNLLGKALPLDVVIAGIPCVGASKAGRSKNKLTFAESHSEAGALFFNFLSFVQLTNPSLVVIENVPEYQNTASMEVIRSVLSSLGYNIQERIFDGNEFGVLEKRKRLCAVALSKGLEGFDIDQVMPYREKEASIDEVLEPIALDSDRWKSFDYLAEKEKRDKAAGKGFARQLLTGAEPFLGTIGKDYAKCRSTEPFIRHPVDSSLSRILTPVEHCRVKGIPEGLIEGNSDTVSHQILGQSVVFPVFVAIGAAIGATIQQNAANDNDYEKTAAIAA